MERKRNPEKEREKGGGRERKSSNAVKAY